MKFKLIIDRVEEDKVVLRHDGKDLLVPKSMFDDTPRQGDAWYLSLSQDATAGEQNQQLAKDILNEILNTDDETL